MTTPLFLLRCTQLGLSMGDLDMLTIGLVNDMMTERENDSFDGWTEVAGQTDFDTDWELTFSIRCDIISI